MHTGCRPTPLPLDCRPLYIGICACACLCLALQSHKRKVTFTPRYLFPLRFSFFRVLPKASAVPLRFMESRERCFLPVLLCAGPGAAGLGVGGGHASPLRKEGAWRDHSTLIACQNIHRSGGKKDREWLKEPKGYSGPVNSHKDSTFTHKSLHKERIMVKLHNISSHG